MKTVVDILLGTYNGEKFLSQQIESIIAQTYPYWHLIVRDDGSTDKTLEILKKYKKRLSEKMILIENPTKKNLGACNNFAYLLNFSNSSYIMFCDQDDVWIKDKIEVTLKKMHKMESQYGKDKPLLIHTDLKVVDENLNPISDSFWKFQYILPEKGKSLNRLFLQNTVTGCTMMINNALKNLVKEIPEGAVMYDWWIALVASAFGKIDYIPNKTVLYRQHLCNEIGAQEYKVEFRVSMKPDLKAVRKNMSELIREKRKDLIMKQQQAKVFFEYFKHLLNRKNYQISKVFSEIDTYSFLTKRYYLLRYKFFEIGFLRNLTVFFCI